MEFVIHPPSLRLVLAAVLCVLDEDLAPTTEVFQASLLAVLT